MIRETVERPNGDVLPPDLDVGQMGAVYADGLCRRSLRLAAGLACRPEAAAKLAKPRIHRTHMLTITHI